MNDAQGAGCLMDWLSALQQCRRENTACVIVMVLSVKGSAPRGVGTRMVVTSQTIYGTIGGGALEQAAVNQARRILSHSASEHRVQMQTFNLAQALSQCCGGQVELQFDLQPASDWCIHVFGAGHVALELARLLARLPCIACFYDERPEWLSRVMPSAGDCAEQGNSESSLETISLTGPGSIITQQLQPNVFAEIEALDPGGFYLVMTHSHALDLEVVEAVLSRGDARYCGLIASNSKAARFRHQLRRKGFTAQEIAGLTAPLGQHIQTGNTPMEVAIAAASDMLSIRHNADR